MASFKRSAESVWKGARQGWKGNAEDPERRALKYVPYSAGMSASATTRAPTPRNCSPPHMPAASTWRSPSVSPGRKAAGRASDDRRSDDRVRRPRLLDQDDHAGPERQCAGNVGGGLQEGGRGRQGRLPGLEALQGRAKSRSTPTRLDLDSTGENAAICGAASIRSYLAPRLRPRPDLRAGPAALLRPSPMRLARSERALA